MVGLALALVGTDGVWASNWNTAKRGVGLHGVFKDEDWSHSFYNNCGFPSKKNVKWHKENDIRFLRFTLKDKQIGTCSSDNKQRSNAPYWERAEIKAGRKGNLFAFNKKRAYQIKFKVRFVSGFTGDRETFLQVHNTSKGCRSSSRPPVMLKFNNGLLEPAHAREDGSGHNTIFLKNPIHISNLYSKWVEFILVYSPSSKKGLAAVTSSIDGKVILEQDKVWQSPCGRPHVKFGIYRPGAHAFSLETSVVDFDYIKINKRAPLTIIEMSKYDRTVDGMKVRFKCLADYAVANDITDLPENQEIESLIANLEGNDYYRSKRQIVKAVISQKAVDANKAALVRLVNYEGTNEEYCAKPVL